MKKIVALVLSLVMVLGLATTAFAAADQYDLYQATVAKVAAGKLVAGATADIQGAIETKAAVKNADGSGNLEYYTVSTQTGKYYVKTTAPTVADYAVTADGKTDILFYLAEVTANDVAYVGEAEKFTNFGTSCGQLYQVDTTKEYYKVTKTSDATMVAEYTVYTKSANTVGAPVLVGNEIVLLSGAPTVGTTLAIDGILNHSWAVTGVKATAAGNVPTEVKCLNCGAVVTKFYDAATKVPAGSVATQVPGYNYWFVAPVAGATTAPEAGDKVNSAETFDAGIAMYVGMSVMAAAGSAVVLKKKD